jgi:non-specific serine/threonine protein kinase
MERGELDEAERLHERSLELFREGKHPWWVALSLGHLAIVRQLQGNPGAAGELVEESLALFRRTGDAVFTAHTLDVVGFGWEQRGDLERAVRCYREALSLHAGQDERSGIAVAFMRLASIAGAGGQWQRAASLFGAMDAVLRLHANPFPQFYQAYADSHLALVREALDEDTFARAWAEGQSMPTAAAMALALAEPPRPGDAAEEAASDQADDDEGPTQEAALPEDLGGLSPRELEVLKLLALGSSNKQIGRALTLSVRTVERHIANVYLKIGAHGRADATSYAFRHGLATPA